MPQAVLAMVKTFYQDEMNDHLTYQALADGTRDPEIQRQMVRIAGMEQRHAAFWQEMLAAHQEPLPPVHVNRVRLLLLRLLRLFINPVVLVSLLELGETRSLQRYLHFFRHADLDEAERQRLRRIIMEEVEHETYFKQTSQALGIGHVRDFVLGMNDGLVEILGAVAGLSAVYPGRPRLVAVSGLIVGVAGALSMGIGAFISVRSQRQVTAGVRERMEILLTIDPDRAVQFYRNDLIASGIPTALANETARTLGRNAAAVTNLVLPPQQQANELRAGLFTGGAYIVGVLFPILPYGFAPSSFLALPFSILFAGVLLALMATVVAMLSGISWRQKSIEMVVSGFAAASLSYGFGLLMRSLFGLAE